MTAPISTPSGSTMSDSATATAAIAPRVVTAPMRAPRSTTSRVASSSVKMPATCAAAISPTECPMTTSGVTPHEANRRASATSNAKMAGWAYSVSSMRGSPLTTTSRTGSGSNASTSRQAASNSGNAAASAVPMPGRCEP